MKKIITVILIFAMLATLVACGQEEPGKVEITVVGVEEGAPVGSVAVSVTCGGEDVDHEVSWGIARGDDIVDIDGQTEFIGPGYYQLTVIYTLPGDAPEAPVTVSGGEITGTQSLGEGRYAATMGYYLDAPEAPQQEWMVVISVSGVEASAPLTDAAVTVTYGGQTLESSLSWSVAVKDEMVEAGAGQSFGAGVYQATVVYTLPQEMRTDGDEIPVVVTRGELSAAHALEDDRYSAEIYFHFHEEQAACEHNWMILSTSGSCSEGLVEHTVCTVCGEKRDEVREPSEHVFDWEKTRIEEPTCGAPGKQRIPCLICGEIIDVPMEPTGEHTWEALPSTGTCTEGIVLHQVCTVCGKTQDSAGEPTDHSLDWENAVVEEATCISPGKRTATCLICGTTVTEETGDIGEHEWEAVETTGTCTEGIVRHQVCTVCGMEDDHTEEPGEHSWETASVTGTCTEGIVLHQVCAVCGETRDSEEEPGEHSFDWENAKVEQAVCDMPGKRTATCLICGAVTTEVIEPTGEHSWKELPYTGTCTEGIVLHEVCTVCSQTRDRQMEPGAHSPDWSGAVVEEPTCSTPGKRTGVCQVCGETVEEIIPATGDHNYKVDILGGNCVTGLKVEYICTACGHSYEDMMISEHSWGKAEYWNEQTHRCICIYCNAVEYFNHQDDGSGLCGGCGADMGN